MIVHHTPKCVRDSFIWLIDKKLISLPIRVICVAERLVCSSTSLTCLIKTFASFPFTKSYKLDISVPTHGYKHGFILSFCVLITDAGIILFIREMSISTWRNTVAWWLTGRESARSTTAQSSCSRLYTHAPLG